MYSIQTKRSGTATISAFVAGSFGFNGIGHVYLGKKAFGIGAYEYRLDSRIFNYYRCIWFYKQ